MFKEHNKGVAFALIAAFISGFSIFINKFAVSAIPQPLIFTTIKNTGVAMLILAIVLTGNKLPQIQKLSRRDLISLLLIGLVGGSIPFYLFFTGLSTIPAVNGAIIQKTMIIWVALLAFPFLKEKFSPGKILAVAFLFAANILVGGFTGFKFSSGELLVLLSTLFWAVETIIAKKVLVRIDPLIVSTARMGIGAIILLTLSNIFQPQAFQYVSGLGSIQWAWIGLTIVSLLAYVTTWYQALRFAPATIVSSILVASTLVTNLLSALLVTHNLNLLTLIQSVLILIGIGLILRLTSQSQQGFSSPVV